MSRYVAIGSLNPVKVQSVKDALHIVFPDDHFGVYSLAVESGVSDQPMSDYESVVGAGNRAQACWKDMNDRYRYTNPSEIGFAIGIEGGIREVAGRYYDQGWVCIQSWLGVSYACSVSMELPTPVMKLVHGGMEVGDACDKFFGQTNSKQKSGHFGLMTNDLITRRDAYRDAIIAAFGPYLKRLEGLYQ